MALGVAVLGSVVNTQLGSATDTALHALSAEVSERAGSGLPGARQAAQALPADAAQDLIATARAAFTDGLGTAALVVAAAVVAAMAVVTTFALRRPAHAERPTLADTTDLPEHDAVIAQ